MIEQVGTSQKKVAGAFTCNGDTEVADDMLGRLVNYLDKSYIVTERKDRINEDMSIVSFKLIERGPPPEELVLELVLSKFHLTRKQFFDRTIKPHKYAAARAFVCYLLRFGYHKSYWAIAKVLKAKCHASALLACKQFDTKGVDYTGWALERMFRDAVKRYKYEKRVQRFL